VQHQNVQHGSVLIRVLRDCYFADRYSLCRRLTCLAAAAAAAIACVAANVFGCCSNLLRPTGNGD